MPEIKKVVKVEKGGVQLYIIASKNIADSKRQQIIDWLKTGFTEFNISPQDAEVSEIEMAEYE